jgi:uncharacterized protein (DUF608 family)
MDFIIAKHDPDENGLLSGEQQTTLDSTESGTGSWLGSLYLAAVHASARMAALVGDRLDAARYRRLYHVGRANQEQLLWNGSYYVEKPEARLIEMPNQPALASATVSYGDGVIADMLLGQWWSTQLGLGDIYDSAHMTQAMRTLFAENFKTSFVGFDTHGGRWFVEPGDQGLVMMTWPHDDRPADASMYADEVWSGTEYSAAATMIQRGLVDDGLSIVKAVNDRYDGRLRTHMALENCGAGDGGGDPFGDDECGKWYARAMSVWSVLLALQGFTYDGDRQRIGFAPRYQPGEHRSFFSAGNAWGTFTQRRPDAASQEDVLEVRFGTLRLRQLDLDPGGLDVRHVRVTLDGTLLQGARYDPQGRTVTLRHGVAVGPGQSLRVELSA